MTGKRLISAIVIVMMLLGLAFTGCSDGGGTGKILKANNTEEPGSLHPGLAQGTHDSWILEHVFEGLYKKGTDGKPVPAMAKEYKVSGDGLTYTFTLRDDVKWTNGDKVTAYDFEYGWKFVLDPAAASEYAYQMYYLKNGQAYNESKITDANQVGVKALDEKTLEVKLESPTPYFLDLTTFYTYYPINKKVQTATPKWYTEAKTYVSNGAFKITEWKHKQSINLRKNEDYYDKEKIKLAGIDFAMISDENTAWQMYKSGQLDMVYPLPLEVTAQLKEKKDPELTIAPDLSTYFYRFNTTKKPFTNLKVRQALAMSINRKAIVEQVTKGGQIAAFAMTPPGIPDVKGDYQKNTGDLFKEDVAQAKQLLAEGLKEEGMDKLSFTIVYNTNEGHKKIAEAIQDMWKKNLGIDVKLENVEFQVKIDREDSLDFEVTRAGWIGDYVDPMTFLDLFTSTSQQNDTGWKNAEYDKLINEAKATTDQSKRMTAMHEAEKILIGNLPIMPVYFYTKPYTTKPYVKGIYDIVNRYPQLHYVDIKK